jgi:UDP-N-acetylglucosamine--N-acetylmuramyl-(pentapeptide) pyrophosphoryl-undecaprenol N-acetylglucosamine transferase
VLRDVPRVLIAGGGTGGHAIPALCVAGSLRRRGAAVEFVGSSTGIESTLVPKAGYTLHAIPLTGLSGGPVQRAHAGFLFLKPSFVAALSSKSTAPVLCSASAATRAPRPSSQRTP